MNDKRYLTYETYNGTVSAVSEVDYTPDVLYNDNVAQWVWLYADNEAEAIASHYAKHEQWQLDVEGGKQEQETY
jgi:hypothetical protein